MLLAYCHVLRQGDDSKASPAKPGARTSSVRIWALMLFGMICLSGRGHPWQAVQALGHRQRRVFRLAQSADRQDARLQCAWLRSFMC